MTYVTWAALYEGNTDAAYFEVLFPRLMENIVRSRPIGNSDIAAFPAVRLQRGEVGKVAQEACANREAFHLVFIHADTGGRGLQTSIQTRGTSYCEAMQALCDWPPDRCISVLPRQETEAWILADSMAVTAALGYRGSPASVGLPANAGEAERLSDPKAVLASALVQVRGRRRPLDVQQLFPAIAQRQSWDLLREAPSFRAFEAQLVSALADLGCI